MATAQTIISAAYRRSRLNQDATLATIPELLDHLNRLYARFYAMLVLARPDLAWTTMDITLMGYPAMAVMPIVPIALDKIHNEELQQVNLIPATERDKTWHLYPCVYRNGAYIISRALGGDPVACDVLTLTINEPPVELTTVDVLIDPRFPLRHHQLLVDSLALYLNAKAETRPAEERAKLAQEYAQALAAFAAEFNIAPEAIQWAHEPVKRQKAVGGAP